MFWRAGVEIILDMTIVCGPLKGQIDKSMVLKFHEEGELENKDV